MILLKFLLVKVAFGSDFSHDHYVHSLAGDEGLAKLVSLSFEGVMKGFLNPLVKVRSLKHTCIVIT